MEAAFVDVGRGRNAVLYAGEVNWDAVGLEGKPRRIESALKSGDPVLVQVTKDPIGHKGARLTSQITLAGRYLVLIPGGSMMGISRKLPDKERARLKKILKAVVPSGSGVIVRTAAEGASEEQIRDDVTRLTRQWEDIEKKRTSTKSAPTLLRGEPELAVRVVRDIFNEDFTKLIIEGRDTYATVKEYVDELSPELSDRVEQWVGAEDVFHAHRIDEQLAKGMDRKVWLPSGGTLIIDRPENYNRTVEELEHLRSQGRVYLFRPERMPIANGELRYDRIVTAFEAGLAQARRELPAIEAFLAG